MGKAGEVRRPEEARYQVMIDRHAATVADAADLAAQIAADLQPDDMIVCLGAGDITKWAAGLAAAISAKSKETA